LRRDRATSRGVQIGFESVKVALSFRSNRGRVFASQQS
jgi:hypothetical protein